MNPIDPSKVPISSEDEFFKYITNKKTTWDQLKKVQPLIEGIAKEGCKNSLEETLVKAICCFIVSEMYFEKAYELGDIASSN